MWYRPIGTLALAYAAALFLGACLPGLPWLQSDTAVGVAFVIGCIFFWPFVVTYTSVGLNSAEGEQPSEATKQRHAELDRVCPTWKLAWYGSLVWVFCCWLVLPRLGLPLHPFHGFTIGISLLSGYWLRFVYPTARDLFSDAATP